MRSICTHYFCDLDKCDPFKSANPKVESKNSTVITVYKKNISLEHVLLLLTPKGYFADTT